MSTAIDVENIYGRLRENRSSPNSRSTFEVVLDASVEVRSALVYATFAVILVFFPVLNMSGLAGRIFGLLGIAYIWAILASLVEKVPSLSLVMAAVALVVALGVGGLFFLNESFLPELREGNMTIHMIAVPGTSLEESLRLGDRITESVLKIPSVQSVAQRAGRAELGTDTMGTHESEIDVNLKARDGNQVSTNRDSTGDCSASGSLLTSNGLLTERINETLSGYKSPVVVSVFGTDLDQPDQEAGQIAGVLSGVRGAAQIQVQSPVGMPQIALRLKRDELAQWGFDPLQVLDVIKTAYGGEIVGQIYEGNPVYDLAVILASGELPRVSEIGTVPLRSPDGNYLLLTQLATIDESSGRYVILHQGARRVQTITCNVQGRAVDSFVEEARKPISGLSLPAGTYVEFSGTAQARKHNRVEISSSTHYWRHWVSSYSCPSLCGTTATCCSSLRTSPSHLWEVSSLDG